MNTAEGHTHDGQFHAHIGGSQPHDHTPTTPYRIPPHTRRIAIGITTFILGAVAQWGPWIHAGTGAYSVATIHGICASGIGQVAQAIDGSAAHGCTLDTAGYGLLWLVVVVGAAFTVWGLLTPRPRM
jgi:hypothetical protein